MRSLSRLGFFSMTGMYGRSTEAISTAFRRFCFLQRRIQLSIEKGSQFCQLWHIRIMYLDIEYIMNERERYLEKIILERQISEERRKKRIDT